MIDSDTPEPLRNIPIQIVVDGIEITGEILLARFNDMSVVILLPGIRIRHRSSRPVVQIWLSAVRARHSDALTDRGMREAKWMLKELTTTRRDDDRDGASRGVRRGRAMEEIAQRFLIPDTRG